MRQPVARQMDGGAPKSGGLVPSPRCSVGSPCPCDSHRMKIRLICPAIRCSLEKRKLDRMARRSLVFCVMLGAAAISAATGRLSRIAAEPPAERKQAAEKPVLKPGQIDLEKSRVFVYVGKKKLGHEHA